MRNRIWLLPAMALLALAALACGEGGKGDAAPRQAEASTAAPVPAATAGPLDREELERRFTAALEASRGLRVVYQDTLGEGGGHWDSDPRYPKGTVNCITWLYLLLAETYGRMTAEKVAVMDRIRYFDGRVGFGFRKHYTDQWVALDPGPLRPVDLGSCARRRRQDVQLEPARFAASVRYSCPLYHAEAARLAVDYYAAEDLLRCAEDLPAGSYVLFPLANERYLQKYGGFSGPMAQVHAVVLRARGQLATGRDLKVAHASIASGKVSESGLGSYVNRMRNLYRGYSLYELDPAWDWRAAPAPLTKEGKAVEACEARLPSGEVGQIFELEAPRQR
jgi:hypothetical protein